MQNLLTIMQLTFLELRRRRIVLAALACEEIWCMLFSEPAGGSDLGSLRTTARDDTWRRSRP